MIWHAGLVARRVGGRWLGVLIEGPSGSGKSDLALRALAEGFRLVADDRTIVWASGGRLYGRAPAALSGLIEARGLDILAVEPLPLAEIGLLVRPGAPDRLPDPAHETVLGVAVRRLEVRPFDGSTPAKLASALTLFDAAHKKRI